MRGGDCGCSLAAQTVSLAGNLSWGRRGDTPLGPSTHRGAEKVQRPGGPPGVGVGPTDSLGPRNTALGQTDSFWRARPAWIEIGYSRVWRTEKVKL